MELKAKVGDKVFITQVTNTEVIIYQLYKKHHIYEVIRIFNDNVDNKDYVIINDETGAPCILFEEDYEVIEYFNSVINGCTMMSPKEPIFSGISKETGMRIFGFGWCYSDYTIEHLKYLGQEIQDAYLYTNQGVVLCYGDSMSQVK